MADRESKEGGVAVIEESANDIRPRALAALARSAVHELHDLHVEVVEEGRGLLLYGSVSSFYHKQLAQETVRAVGLGIIVINSIRVS
jgi:hypothetical protein